MDFLPVFPSLPWSVADQLEQLNSSQQTCAAAAAAPASGYSIFVNWPYDWRFLQLHSKTFLPLLTKRSFIHLISCFSHTYTWGKGRQGRGGWVWLPILDILSQDFASTLPWNNFRCCCLFNNNLKLYVTHLSFFGYEWVWWCVSRAISPHALLTLLVVIIFMCLRDGMTCAFSLGEKNLLNA